jgi:hypothetical protein
VTPYTATSRMRANVVARNRQASPCTDDAPCRLSRLVRNVPVLNSLEMSPG